MNAVAAAYRDEIIAQTQGLQLLGEIITWDLDYNTRTTYQDLLNALNVSGLDTKVARKLLPRFAFARAAGKMEEERIIRKVGEADGKLAFQFTKEYKDAEQQRYDYSFEATLLLEKTSGHIEVVSDVMPEEECQKLAALATELLTKAIEERTTADVTRVIKRLFEKQADLFPVRNAGSVYFVPEKHTGFVDQVERFVTQLNGQVNRFPVPAGTQRGNKSVREAVTDGLQQMVREHFAAIQEFGDDTRPSTVEKALARVEKTAFKLQAYRDYLAEERDNLEIQLQQARIDMKQKLSEILSAKSNS